MFSEQFASIQFDNDDDNDDENDGDNDDDNDDDNDHEGELGCSVYTVRQIMITPYNLREDDSDISTDLSDQLTLVSRSVYHFEHSYYLLQKKLPQNFSQEKKVSYDFF